MSVGGGSEGVKSCYIIKRSAARNNALIVLPAFFEFALKKRIVVPYKYNKKYGGKNRIKPPPRRYRSHKFIVLGTMKNAKLERRSQDRLSIATKGHLLSETPRLGWRSPVPHMGI
jgi:hypothetical protein